MILLDSSIIIAFFNKRDKNHKRALELMEKALINHYGTIFISDYVFDETITYLLKKTKRYDIAIRAGNVLLGKLGKFPNLFRIIFTDKTIFDKSWDLFERLSKKGLSFTDCVLLSLAKNYGMPIMTFDKDFIGLVEVIQ